MEQHGFRVNKSKCKIVSVNDDTTILGMPIGSQEFVNDSFKVLVEDMQSKVSLIDTKCIKSKSRLTNLLEGLYQYNSHLFYSFNIAEPNSIR